MAQIYVSHTDNIRYGKKKNLYQHTVQYSSKYDFVYAVTICLSRMYIYPVTSEFI